jgi:hypothetical protein
MSTSIRKPNDVWLRIWLIVSFLILCTLNLLYAYPWFTHTFGADSVIGWIQPVIYSIAVAIIMTILWNKFKRPDCKCWDDIPDTSGRIQEPTKVTKLTGKRVGQAEENYL